MMNADVTPVESVPEIFIGDVQKSCIRGPADVVDENIDAAEALQLGSGCSNDSGRRRSAAAQRRRIVERTGNGLGPATTMPPTVAAAARAAQTAAATAVTAHRR